MFHIFVYVPKADREAVKQACFSAGAGRIGDYSHACWETSGTGQFMPLNGASPHIGRPGRLETVEEVKLEFIADDNCVAEVVTALKNAHPYEEPAWGAIRLSAIEDVEAAGAQWL